MRNQRRLQIETLEPRQMLAGDTDLFGSMPDTFSQLSGSAEITDEAVTVDARSHLSVDAPPAREAGQVHETRMTFTVSNTDDTHLYYSTDTAGGNGTEHGLTWILSDSTMGLMRMNNGRPAEDLREEKAIEFGEYQLTIREDDALFTATVVLPSGETKVHTHDAVPLDNNGEGYMNLGGVEITSFHKVLVGDDALPEEVVEEAIEAIAEDVAAATNMETQTVETALLGGMSESVTVLSGSAEVTDEAITSMERSFLVSDAIPERQTGEVYETRIRLTVEPTSDDDTHVYLYNDTNAKDHENGYGLILHGSSMGIMQMANGRFVADHREDVALAYGEYEIVIRDDDTESVFTVTMPNGETKTYTHPQIAREHSGQVGVSAGGTTIHSFEVVKISEEVVAAPVIEEAVEAIVANVKAEAPVVDVPAPLQTISMDNTPEERLAMWQTNKAARQSSINNLMLQMNDMMTEIDRETNAGNRAVMGLDYTALEEQMHALERAQIPYGRMHVTPVNVNADDGNRHDVGFEVRYMSNLPETFFYVGNGRLTQLVEHESGMEDGTARFNFLPLYGMQQGGEVRIQMYSDADRTQLLDEFVGIYDQNRAEARGESDWEWGDMETGRIVETPYVPTASVVKLSGPNVILAVQSPYDTSRVEMEGGGMFNRKIVEHSGGSELDSVRLTFNADNPTGDYGIKVFEGRGNRQVTGAGVHWDAETRELSMVDENSTIVAAEDTQSEFELRGLMQQMDAQMSVDTNNLVSADLVKIQGEQLFDQSSFQISGDDVAGYIAASPHANHPDVDGMWAEGLLAYESGMKQALSAAEQVAVSSWNGESQEEAIAYFNGEYDRVYSRYVKEFESVFGIYFPSREEVLLEGCELARANTDNLINLQVRQVKKQEELILLANAKDPSVEVDRSPEAIKRQQLSIIEAWGDDYIGYASTVNRYFAAINKEVDKSVIDVVAYEAGGGDGSMLLASAGSVNYGGGGIEFATSIVAAEYNAEASGEILDGDSRLDRWWATAGESPIDTSWTVEVARSGMHRLKVTSSDWGFDNAALYVNGTMVDMTSGKSALMHLPMGIHTFEFRGVGVPTTPTVDEVNFHLWNATSTSAASVSDFDAMFIADHVEEFDESSTFRIAGDDGVETVIGVSNLVNEFAPILHFNEGEDYTAPMDAEAFFAASGMENDGNANASFDMPEMTAEGKVYASVLRNPSDPGKLAINYYFFYPKSNWHTKGGYNDHEGDWEGVTLFLEMNGDMNWVPKELALAQHTEFPIGTTEQVDGGDIHSWDALETENNQLHLYVGLGGHATFIKPGVAEWDTKDEFHSGNGQHFSSLNKIEVLSPVGSNSPAWLTYAGLWGNADLTGYEEPLNFSGDAAPFGPVFSERWTNPWGWSSDFINFEE